MTIEKHTDQRKILYVKYNIYIETRLKRLVSPDEQYDMPKELPDKYAVLAPFDYKLSAI